MAKRSEIGFRIMAVDENGNVVCIHDESNASGRRDDPYHDKEACEKLKEKIIERVSRRACEIYSEDPKAFPIALSN